MIALLFAAMLASSSCPVVDGAASLFTSNINYVWVGEVHGTNEQPELFGDLVCLAAASRPVVVALEREISEQPLWDAYLASDGGSSARTAFLQARAWTWEIQDGRSSQAMLALAERLRLAKRAGALRGVYLILAGGEDRGLYERAMAESVLASRGDDPGTLVMAFSGNYHAKRGELTRDGKPYALAASAMPPSQTRLVFVRGGSGTAWNCQVDCGPNPTKGWDGQARRIDFTTPPEGYDAVAYTGRPSTASPPAAQPAVRVALPKG